MGLSFLFSSSPVGVDGLGAKQISSWFKQMEELVELVTVISEFWFRAYLTAL